MTPIKAIAYTIDRDKHKEQQAKRLKENYGRFRAKVVRDGVNSLQRGLHDRDGEIPG